ncbi:ABC transporter ATP-binding protein [Novimethylophilus kurashikiensis]|uniref:ABC transporter ATP-binding protein n=1 Tax=Novimethylophilus kurashikiensis TaxID=1825523 RepID=A0A2R5F960_9PROT|nr:hypothetical protein [Novimethylophilus kurashikiensis]GBG14766.1 ABC transporter ATP-binding protein [Novimethylophilus kurashikiensis]
MQFGLLRFDGSIKFITIERRIMNKLSLNRIAAVVALCSIGFMSTAALAGPDEFQLQLNRKAAQARQKLQQAEAAKGEERQKLMAEHMKLMHETMGKMQEMKPKAGMSMQEHEEWITEHQKLMDDLMGQMMQEHHMLMGKDMGMDCNMGASSDAHKH